MGLSSAQVFSVSFLTPTGQCDDQHFMAPPMTSNSLRRLQCVQSRYSYIHRNNFSAKMLGLLHRESALSHRFAFGFL